MARAAVRGPSFCLRSSHATTKRRIPLPVFRRVGLAMSHWRIEASCWRTSTPGKAVCHSATSASKIWKSPSETVGRPTTATGAGFPGSGLDGSIEPSLFWLLASGFWALSGGLTPSLRPGLPPFRPLALSLADFSASRCIRRLKIVPSASRLKTPASSSSLRRSPTSPPAKADNWRSVTARPFTRREPYGIASCMMHSISIHRPRAASEHMRSAGSARQSVG